MVDSQAHAPTNLAPAKKTIFKLRSAAVDTDSSFASTRLRAMNTMGVWLIGIWMTGSLVLIVRHLRKVLRCRRFLRSCCPITDITVREIFLDQCGRLGLLSKPFFSALIALLLLMTTGLAFALLPLPTTQTYDDDPIAAADEDIIGTEKVAVTRNPGNPNAEPLTIAGIVLDNKGKPAVGATVHVGNRYSDIDLTTNADAEGSFELDLRVEKRFRESLKIFATSVDDTLSGYSRVSPNSDTSVLDAVEIRLVSGMERSPGARLQDLYATARSARQPACSRLATGFHSSMARCRGFCAIKRNLWSAPSQSGFDVLPGKVMDNCNFVLGPATKVFGQVLNEATGKPVKGKTVVLTQNGVDLQSMGNDILPNAEKSNRRVVASQEVISISNEDGRFEVFVGEGWQFSFRTVARADLSACR